MDGLHRTITGISAKGFGLQQYLEVLQDILCCYYTTYIVQVQPYT